jgi:hypothetical protein
MFVLAAPHESVRVQGFGRRPTTDDAAAPGLSSESLQRRNPREVGGGAAARYGDFGAVPPDVTAADVAGGVIVRRRGAGDAARDAWQRELEGDLSFADLGG